jgi:hypothetical protein
MGPGINSGGGLRPSRSLDKIFEAPGRAAARGVGRPRKARPVKAPGGKAPRDIKIIQRIFS